MKDRENRTEGERAKTAQLAGVFSVVIASFRSAACWKDAVRSVLIQDYPAIELIFCDDGSEGVMRRQLSNSSSIIGAPISCAVR